MNSAAQRLVARINELGLITDEPGHLTRTFLSPAMRRANALVGNWMRDAGLDVRVDTVGNLIGRLQAADPKAKTLLLGSHLDTVRHAGNFDGALGVLLPIAALEELKRRGITLPYSVEVIGFSEEEGVRFASAYFGSSGYAGKLDKSLLQLRDPDGVTALEALKAFNGGTFTPPKPAHPPASLLGYVEVHIEQGPVLQKKDLAIGVVTAIAGQSRFSLTWTGQAGHAGTTPMKLRRDALAAAAEFTLTVESLAMDSRGLLATVGMMTVVPGAANVIPREVVHSLDIRHARDISRHSAIKKLSGISARIAARRNVTCTWNVRQQNNAVACSPGLTNSLCNSVRRVQQECPKLVSGAGHDGVIISALTPIAMLFIRCRDGLSHHPDEFASPQDIEVALRVLMDFLMHFSGRRKP